MMLLDAGRQLFKGLEGMMQFYRTPVYCFVVSTALVVPSVWVLRPVSQGMQALKRCNYMQPGGPRDCQEGIDASTDTISIIGCCIAYGMCHSCCVNAGWHHAVYME
jgi:hypothetical protein